MKKQFFLLILIMLISGTMLFSNGKDDSGSHEGGSEVHPLAGTTNIYGWTVPEQTIEFTASYGQQDPDVLMEKSALQREYLYDNFNVIIHPLSWETDYTERQSLMLASGDYPDVITKLSVEQAQNWVDAEVALDMLPTVMNESSEIKDVMGHYFNRYLDDGKLYALPDMWGYWEAPQVCPNVRLDWWEEIDKKEFSSPEEYYAVLKEMVANHPKGVDGKPTYALGMATKTLTYARYYQGMYGLYKDWAIDDSNNLTYWTETQEALDLTLWLNRIQLDGLLDPDSFTQSASDLKSKYANERYAGYLGSWWRSWNMGHEQWQDRDENWTENQRYIHVNVTADGLDHSTYSPIRSMGYYRTIVTEKAEDRLDDIISWFSFEMTDPGMRLMGWGVPNEPYSGWTLKDDGTAVMNENMVTMRIANDGEFDFERHEAMGTMIINNTIRLMKDDQSLSGYWDVNFRDKDKWFDLMYKNMEGTSWDSAYLDSISIDPDDMLSTTKKQLEDLTSSGWAEAVMASSPEKAKEAFMKMRESVRANGVDELEAYYANAYKANITNWK